MDFFIMRKGKQCILHIEGDSFSIEEKEALRIRLAELTKKEPNVAVNVKKLSYANSQLLGQFLVAFKVLQKKKGTFSIIAPTKSVNDLLRVTGMDKIFTIYHDEKAFEKAV